MKIRTKFIHFRVANYEQFEEKMYDLLVQSIFFASQFSFSTQISLNTVIGIKYVFSG